MWAKVQESGGANWSTTDSVTTFRPATRATSPSRVPKRIGPGGDMVDSVTSTRHSAARLKSLT